MGFKQWVLASLFYKSCLFACLLCSLILTGSDSNFSCPLGRPSSCICVPYILPSPTYGAKLPTKAWAYEWLGACKCCWQHTTASSAECVSKFVLQVLLACYACSFSRVTIRNSLVPWEDQSLASASRTYCHRQPMAMFY